MREILRSRLQFIIQSMAFLFILAYCDNANAQTTEAYNWGNVAIGGGGFVSGIVNSVKQPGLMYARTDVGGAYRWDATNSKWIPLLDLANENQQGYMGVLSIAIDSKTPSVVYMAVGISYFNGGNSYILRSADYGATFTSVNVTSQFRINGNANGREDGERLQVDPLNSSILFCGSQANGLFKSTNSGSTWTNVAALGSIVTNNANGVNLVVMDTTSSAVVNGALQTQRMFVGVSRQGGNNLYRSDDGGTTFTAIAPPNPIDAAQLPHRAVLGNGYLYVTYSNGGGPGSVSTAEPCSNGQIWKYKIADGSWTNITPVQSGASVTVPWCGISIDPGNPNRVIASTTNRFSFQYNSPGGAVYGDKIFLTTDGGNTWTDIVGRGFSLNANGQPWIIGQSIHWAGSIQFDPSNTNRIFINSGNGVFVNSDITSSAGVWSFTVKGLEETVPQNLISIAGGGPIVSTIGDYDGFTQSDPTVYAANRHTPSMGSTYGLDYAVNAKKVVRVASSMYYSTDQGFTWTKTTGTLKGSNGQVAVSADGNVILHCPSGSTSTYRSPDNGATWTASTGLTVNTRPVSDGLNPNKFYAYDSTNGKFFVSTDGGVSFTASTATIAKNGSVIIRTIPNREGSVWIALYGGGLVYIDNSATTAFNKVTKVTYCESVGIGKASTTGGYETIYIWGTVNGVSGLHRSTDKGANWTRVNDDNHQYGGPANGQFVQGDMNTYGRVYMSSAGRGIVLGTAIAALSVTPTTLGYAPGSGSQVINITSNQTTTISSNQSWLTTSAASKYNSDTLTVSVTPNTGATTRTGTITIIGGGITATISVTQTAASTVYYSKSTGDLSSLSTYGTAADGTGTTPADFNGSAVNTVYQLANRSSYSLSADLAIGGGTLNIPSGATLDLAGHNLTLPKLAGAGTLSTSSPSGLTVTGKLTALTFAAGSNKLNSLVLGTGANVTLASVLNITGTGSVSLTGTDTLNTGGYLNLKSDATGTATVKSIGTGTIITGSVTAERYVADKRSWRLITSAVNSSQSINAAYQEGAGGTSANPNPGYGTYVIGGVAGDGFDANSSSSSLLVFSAGNLNNIANTNVTPINTYPGFFLFVIGDRSLNFTNSSVHSATVLRSTGLLRTGTQNYPVNAAGYTLIGNPYAAPVDFSQSTLSSSMPNQFYAWDSQLGSYGGYVLISSAGGGTYTSVPASPGGLTNIIQSGQAIFVQSDGSNPGTITFNESSKASGNGLATFSTVSNTTATHQDFRINLANSATNGSNPIDGVMASYDAAYSNAVDNADAGKLVNFYENMSLVRSNKLLTLEKRQAMLAKDTLYIQLTGMQNQGYQLQVDPGYFKVPGMTAYLEDAYLHTHTKLDLTQSSSISFTAGSDTASYKNRFMVTFTPASQLLAFKAVAGNKTGKLIDVKWNVTGQDFVTQYTLEKWNGTAYTAITSVPATTANSYATADVSAQTGDNTYRLKATDSFGNLTYSDVVTVKVTGTGYGVSVYPNPVTQKKISIGFAGLPAGSYNLTLVNSFGRVLEKKAVSNSGNSITQISADYPSGVYVLSVNSTTFNQTQKVIIP